ncbi:UDP-glycosyltransferase 88F3-like [Macadamia integrifolia]|uniref:UDP-glycosyltransferase 88F3-like n=1 Tax=Macadamia integrifolia TaxID=60698 RepID=UPI001C4E8FA4|nr:UDP-glycosyltransferase 88F3-like [Macadamia integrifolia]
MKDTIVLYPAPGISHLTSMVELGKLILRHYNSRFSLTIVITSASFDSAKIDPYIEQVSQTNPSIAFHRFPSLPNRPSLKPPVHPVAILLESISLNNPNLLHTLKTISETSSIAALVIDFFCNPASHVATELSIPLYYYFPTNASIVAMFLHLPILHNETDKSFRELGNTILHVPGLPPVRASHMSASLLDRNNQVYDNMLGLGTQLLKSKGIISNTIEALEPEAIKVIKNQTPAIFCVGPMITEPGDQSSAADWLSWLDKQPSGSVLFLCFGSRGVFSVKQISEIAVGLERSGQRFLWVVKDPPPIDTGVRMMSPLSTMDFDLEAVMPEGFLERTRDRGLVVKSWAPQVEVLNRESVGGFVTHCGWNSVLEAVSAGVPMVAWPLYAEQHINKEVLVEAMRVALPMEAADEDGFVVAAEVEKRVRMLMDSDEGTKMRKLCGEMKGMALAAWAENGSSRAAFNDLAQSWNRG